MDIYKQRSVWNIVLLFVGLAILLVTSLYANYLANELSKSEEKNKLLYEEALDILASSPNFEDDVGTELLITESISLPVISRKTDRTYSGNNWGEKNDTTEAFLKKKFEQGLAQNIEPIYSLQGEEILVFQSPLNRYIKFFPWLQFLMVGIFVGFGYFLFNSTRRAEQNRVWAGMAKETAHQLGTPISAILAWIEFLKESNTDRPDQLEVIEELDKDVDRLELIADRFSKIGSDPELEVTDIFQQLSEIKTYMKRRSPRKVSFEFQESDIPLHVQVNRHLFSWVLENLIRNSLDALDGEGIISAKVVKEGSMIKLDLSDTGKGIPSSRFKDVFKPGYSTKKRGWGLGLSLAKRIIEEYHQGKIFVKNSKLNEGTTFTIQIPAD